MRLHMYRPPRRHWPEGRLEFDASANRGDLLLVGLSAAITLPILWLALRGLGVV